MFDLTSTTTDVSEQEGAHARLLVAVIGQAIKDASLKPSKAEASQRKNINGDAIDALHFLFGPNPTFAEYAELIGSSAESIRAALTESKYAGALNGRFPDTSRRKLQVRLHWLRCRQGKKAA